MPEIIVRKPFKFAHHGYQVEEFEVSDEPRETTDECADLAVQEGWAERPQQPAAGQVAGQVAGAPEGTGDAAGAPENRDAARKGSNA